MRQRTSICSGGSPRPSPARKNCRARDAYGYVLANCDNPQERVATVQKAIALLTQSDLDILLKYQRGNEFAPVLDDLTRRRVGKAAEDPKLTAAPEDLARVEALAKGNTLSGDPLVPGWARRSSEGAGLVQDVERSRSKRQGRERLCAGVKRPRPPHRCGRLWLHLDRQGSGNLKAYLDVVTRLLGADPPIQIEQPVMKRITEVIAHERNAPAGEQLGWYAYNIGQIRTAAHWFQTVLQWQAGYEPAAYGLVVALLRLNDKAGAQQVVRSWQERSARIAALGRRRQSTRALPTVAVRTDEAAAAGDLADASPEVPTESIPLTPSRDRGSLPETAGNRGAGAKPRSRQALFRPNARCRVAGCLMDLNRPVEAAAAFAVAQRSAISRVRADAAYGSTLADLRSNVTDRAAASASREPLGETRLVEMTIGLLTQQATAASTGPCRTRVSRRSGTTTAEHRARRRIGSARGLRQ